MLAVRASLRPTLTFEVIVGDAALGVPMSLSKWRDAEGGVPYVTTWDDIMDKK